MGKSDGAGQGAPWAWTRDDYCVTGEMCAHLHPQEAYAEKGQSEVERQAIEILGVRRTDSSFNVRACGRR